MNPSSIMNLKTLSAIVLIGLCLLSKQVHSQTQDDDNKNSLLWVAFSQNKSDYFGDNNSTIKPDGNSVGFSYDVNQRWQFSISYSEQKGSGTWPIAFNDTTQLTNRAETESHSSGASVTWKTASYDLTLAYSQLDTSERALTRLPLIFEEVEGDDQVVSLSYQNFAESDAWVFGWSLGLQYADSTDRTRQTYFMDPPVLVAAQFEQTSWSGYIDLDISHWFELTHFSFAPQLTLSRNWEISSSGTPLLVITRADERRVFNQFDDPANNNFRVPDSGFWQLAFIFDWQNDWSSSLSYGKTMGTESAVSSLSLDVSVAF